MHTHTDPNSPAGLHGPAHPPGIFINTPERSPDDAANDPFMLEHDCMASDRDNVAIAGLNGREGLTGIQHNGNTNMGHVAEAPLSHNGDASSETRHLCTWLTSLFRDLPSALTVRLWDGQALHLGSPASGRPAFELICRTPRAIRALAFSRDPLRVAEAYFRNDIDVSGDFFAALKLKDHLARMRPSLMQRMAGFVRLLNWSLLQAPAPLDRTHVQLLQGQNVRRHSRSDNEKAIAFHYDVSNRFYALWLDERMVYSCAYFQNAGDSLERAQIQKLDHICRKLMLRPDDRLLDVGCGWGGLALHAARRYGAQVHGITLSRQQWEWATREVRRQGLQGQVQIDLCDYRDLGGENRYDKISSVGMFEHVGLSNLPVYFGLLHRMLKPGGLILNHGIAHEQEGWGNGLSSRFINRYVFPDGELDSISRVQCAIERSGFEIHDLENLRPHYAQTLRHWVERLEARHDEALQHVDEATWRIWRLFMAASALEFESGELAIHQILASKRKAGVCPLPLTRDHLYGSD